MTPEELNERAKECIEAFKAGFRFEKEATP